MSAQEPTTIEPEEQRAALVPGDLEQVVLTRGPRILRELVRGVGGVGRAARTAKVSTPTVSRWLAREPGSVFGSPREGGSYRSIWYGYPSPFPGMDRAVEELIGPDQSYLGALVDRYGWERTWRHLRSGRGFGLDLLDFEEHEVAEACDAVGIPRTTRTRWWTGHLYPKQWRALDSIAQQAVGTGWIEAVLSVKLSVRRAIPKSALACLIDEIQHGTLVGGSSVDTGALTD